MYKFDNARKEIAIEKYNTPTPWMNYLSNGVFHTMISQAGGGVAFYKSPQIWRINHYKFFHIPTDRSGFYTYIKDNDEYFCPTNEPCKEKPEKWRAVHGMGYTRFESERRGVEANTTYFVGEYENCLIWNLNLKNNSQKAKKLSVFAYVELGMMEFMRELQWQCYNKHQLSVYNLNDILVYKYGVETQPRPDETPLIYFAADFPIKAYDGDRDEFIGSYRSEENPQNVEKGHCTNSLLKGGDPCFALEFEVELNPNETKEINIFLGAAMMDEDIKKAVAKCREKDFVSKSFAKLNEGWDNYLSKFSCTLPDKDVETMINVWNPYQAHRNFLFSRNISYYATGTFRGVGFRDTAQDILAIVPFSVEMAKEKAKLLLTQQYNDGHTNHYFFPNEGWEPITRIHSDNHLWIIMAVYSIVIEEGSLGFLSEVVPYFDGGEATVWEHLKKSIDFVMSNLGERGLPLMLASDWNDMLYKVCREGKGESVMICEQLGLCCQYMAELAELSGENSEKYLEIYESQKKLLNTTAWDGEWYIRATMDSGRYVGSKNEPQAKIWLNSQTWSVISGMADTEKAVMAMDNVKKYLDTELGVKKIHPSMEDYPSKDDPLTHYNKGCGENGSVFCHSNTWAIIAECLLKRPDNAYKYYHQLLPMIAQQKAGEWRYKAEPYVYCSNIFGPESDKFGLANVSWLSGTAAWMYVAFTQYILGIKAKWDGLEIDPCLPSCWSGVTVTKTFRGCKYNITINKNEKIFIPHVDGRTEYNSMVSASMSTDTLTASEQLKSFAPLSAKNKLNIVYLGGSITQGAQSSLGSNSWVGRVSNMFVRAFPDKTINNYNAGVGGTGSDLGLFRLYDDVISKDPDIVFVEFAVNDQEMAAAESQKQMEGIVRNLLQLPKQPIIIFVYTTTNQLKAFDTVHAEVAAHYQIPEIDLQNLMKAKVQNGENIFTYLGDGVHPNDHGYFTYAEYIISCLNQPATYLKSAVWNNTPLRNDYYQYTGKKILASDSKITKTGAWSAVDGAGTISSNTPNDALTCTFDGPFVGIMHRIGLSYGYVEVRIDGILQEVNKNGNLRNYVDCYYNVSSQPVMHFKNMNLTDTTHTLEIKVINDKNSSSAGNKFTLDYLYVKK